MTTFLIDFAIIGIVVFCGWRGYKNGLIRGVFGVVALVVSIFVASFAATAYSEEFVGILTPFVGGIVDTTLTEMAEQNVEYEFVEHENDSARFRTAYTALRKIGMPEASAIRLAEMAADEESEGFISDLVAEKLSSVLAYVAVFGIAFALLAIVFAVIGNLVGFVFSLPGLKIVDIISGVVFGLAKGILIVLTIAVVVRYFGLVAVSTIEETSILNYFVNNNPIADILGL